MQITDPMISESGELYSLAGIKKLLNAVTKNGNNEKPLIISKRKKHDDQI